MTILHAAGGRAGPRWEQAINLATAVARPESIGTVGVTLPGTPGAGDWSSGSYSYDGAGNITAMGSESYSYDTISRLVSSTRAGGETYTYDPFGNLINYNGRTLSVLGTTNRLAAAGYDASGNMTAWNGFSFAWDALDRMTALAGNGLARRFAFTASGERVLEREGSTYSFSLRGLDNRVLREMKAAWTGAGWSWAWEKDSIWGAGRLVASVSASDGIRHAHVDHLGSPRLLTNRCGQRVALLDHNPWGLDRPSGTQHGERHRFTAHQRDLGSLERTWDDFDYLHARYYNPNVARFLSVDPAGGKPASPQSWNRYAYALNNPTRYVDPNGEDAIDFVNGLVNAFSSNMLLGAGRQAPVNGDYAGGQAVGDILAVVAGSGEATLGFGGGAFGLGLTGTGVGALVGAPMTAAASVMVVQGVGGATTGAVNLVKFATGKTPHGEQRQAEAKAGDAQRQVGDPNRVVQEGQKYIDKNTGNTVYVKGNRVVIHDPQGNLVSQFKNSRRNTTQRVEDGRWVLVPESSTSGAR